ncbi:MAG: hypothetical protein ACK5ME_09805 [Parahaliea sp.]
MNKKLLDELLYCLADEKTVVHYFKDKYCLFLLKQCAREKTTVQAIRNSPVAHLLQKPLIRQWLANCGGKQISPSMVDSLWPTQVHHFTLSMDSWGGNSPAWQQTCRKGHNLVLQLNFPAGHTRLVRQVSSSDGDQFKCFGHPINTHRQTMAWARLDISDDMSEVLIEEVQNDWLRKVMYWHQYLSEPTKQEQAETHGFVSWASLDRYVEKYIKPLLPIWHEAMLCSALEFIRCQLGIKRVYMYEHETGVAMKNIGQWSQPPRSLYSKLPRQFGFRLTNQTPGFLADERFVKKKIKRFQKKKDVQWFYLDFNNMEETRYAS